MKIKYENDGCFLIAKAKCGFGEQIQHDMLEMFNQKGLSFFLKAMEIKKRKVSYRGVQSVSLKEYLKNPISKFDFLFILAQFARLIKIAEGNNLPLSYISYDLSNCFLTENTKELQLVFLPIKTKGTRSLPNDFVEAFVYSSKPVNGDDYISTFAYFYRKQAGFNPKAIERYIEKEECKVFQLLDGKKIQVPHIAVSSQESCSGASVGKGEYKTSDPDDTVLGDELPSDDTLLRDDTLLGEEDTLLGKTEDETLLGNCSGDDEETAYLVPKTDTVSPFLRRVSTNEVIRITKPSFRIGTKESEVDYVVRNNNTISRSHADIIVERGEYFVYDLSSKNKTYVNDRVIPVQTRVQIYPNDIIRLSDEDFAFCVG